MQQGWDINEELLCVLISCGFDINQCNDETWKAPVFESDAFDMLVFAAHGARHDLRKLRYNGKILTLQQTIQHEIHHMEDHYFRHKYSIRFSLEILRLCSFLVMGGVLEIEENCKELFNIILVKEAARPSVQLIMESGFQPDFQSTPLFINKTYAEERDRFKKMYNRPLSLERLAANAIRRSLKPNAIVGARKLVEQGKLPPVASISECITLGVTMRRNDFNDLFFNNETFDN